MIVAFTDGGICKGTSCGGAILVDLKGPNDYKFAEIDDLDPVEYPKENKEEK